MAINDKHPEYINRIGEWIQMGDTYAGEREIKRKRIDYLPPTSAMVQDGMTAPQSPGWVDYEAYLQRAVYHDVIRDAVKAMVGIMHMKPATITLPERMQPMLNKATVQGEGLQMLLRRINEAQLVKGRCGLLVEAPTGVDVNKAIPYIAFYDPERIINWDAGIREEGKNELEMVVIDESGKQRHGFIWKDMRKHRILKRGPIDTPETNLEAAYSRPGADDPYQVCVKIDDLSMPVDADFITPQIGGRDLKVIPFVFCGANDLVPEPEVPPLLGLSNLALAIYRGEADYRQTLFMQGQQTLVIIGGNTADKDEPLRVGAKGVIDLKIGGDAKYIGVTAAGLGEMRQSLTSDKASATAWGVSFMDVGNARGESGEALRIRVAARTTTISSVAQTGGSALEQVLKYAAMWMGEDPDQVRVEPTTDFADVTVQGATVLAFMQAKQLGLPLSDKSMHRSMRANDLTELTYEEETDQIAEEKIAAAQNAMALNTALGLDPLTGQPLTDASFGDTAPTGDAGSSPSDTGGEGAGVIPPAPIAAPVAPGKSVPITPHARSTPNPIKLKVGKKGASAGK
jgi:hypothetical protein